MKRLRLGFQFQFLLVSSVFLLLVNIFVGYFMMEHAKVSLKKQIEERMLDVTNLAASCIDGDMYERLTGSDADSPEYKHVFQVLSTFHSNSSLEYVYGLRREKNGSFIFTIDPALSNAAAFGETALTTDALVSAANGVPSVTHKPYSDGYGTFYTSYSPIRNSYGDIVGFAAADCDANWYEEQMNRIAVTVLLSCAFSMSVGAGIVMLFTGRLRRRFKELNSEMHDLAVDVDSFTQKMTGVAVSSGLKTSDGKVEDTVDHTESLLDLEKRSYDEIHELGDQIRNMRHDLQEHIEKVYSLAFKDPLTGVKSKQAYVEYEKMLDRMLQEGSLKELAVAVFDVNGLKIVNDTLGHQLGDRLLKEGCTAICDVFVHSPVFRVGGDEFVVVLKGQDFDDRARLFDIFHSLILSNQRAGKVVVASGFSDFIADTDTTVQDVLERADKLMYLDKDMLKKNML